MITMTITDTFTNEQVEFVWEDVNWHDDPDTYEYMFGDGNYSCDCNRRIWFDKTKGIEYTPIECGDKQFIIKKITDDKGEIVYAETER